MERYAHKLHLRYLPYQIVLFQQDTGNYQRKRTLNQLVS